MTKLSAIDLFGKWADLGRDKGMEEGHSKSVKEMINAVKRRIPKDFTAIDVGCGNGWAVRKLTEEKNCSHCYGVDGSESMIRKARSTDPEGDYVVGKLPGWSPPKTVDLVLSMEFIYYLEDPLDFFHSLHADWLSPRGIVAIGLDHYFENKASLSWPESLEVDMATMSIAEWALGLKRAGFIDVESFQVNSNDENPGTLVLLGTRP